MPRLPASLLRRAHKISPLLPPLLKTVRELPDAITELRWLRAHAAQTASPEKTLSSHVHRRGHLAEPLQYILGTQPFGSTEILCRRGALVPRAETEESISHLAELLAANISGGRAAKVVDLCTGTGCIPLLLAAEMPVVAVGVDISHAALELAMENLAHNQDVLKAQSRVQFVDGDVLSEEQDEVLYAIHACFDDMDQFHAESGGAGIVDVVVSNPPYISSDGYKRETARSVRNWEPRIALEAGMGGDVFYPRVGSIAWELGARVVVAEVGGWEQAERVRKYWTDIGWAGTAVWKDFAGRGRTVVAWRQGAEWVRNGPSA